MSILLTVMARARRSIMLGIGLGSLLPPLLPALLTTLLAIAVGLGGCADAEPPTNVILISIDTLRADALGAYGYERDTSPRLSALADESFVFTNAFTHSANTITSHASMLTGLHPHTHGTRSDVPLSASFETLAESLAAVGFRTGGFTTHGDWLSAKKGFDQGFDTFESRFRRADRNNRAVLDWIDSISMRVSRFRGEAFFLFIHYYDVHSDWNDLPYESDPPYASLFGDPEVETFQGCRGELCGSKLLRQANLEPDLLSEGDVRSIRDLYDGGVAQMDRRLGELFDELIRRDLYDQSWIIVTADHGEEFREHGLLLHSQPYRETARVPLLVRPPGGTVRRDLDGVAGLVDLMPTILETFDAERTDTLQGTSLLAAMRGGESENRRIVFDDYHQEDTMALRDGRFTLVLRDGGRVSELYDRSVDPAERNDVAASFPEVERRLTDRARRMREEQLSAAQTDPTNEPISAEEKERLRALGYVE